VCILKGHIEASITCSPQARSLFLAVDTGLRSVVESITKLCTTNDLNSRQGLGKFTPLMMTIARKHPQVTLTLIRVKGVDVNAQDACGFTALMAAVTDYSYVVSNALLQLEQVDVDIGTEGDLDALKTALWWGRDEDVMSTPRLREIAKRV
jgi:hypothetical protein